MSAYNMSQSEGRRVQKKAVLGLSVPGYAQYDSPLPPRALAIPGAIPAGGRGRGPQPTPVGPVRRIAARGRAGNQALRGRAQPPPLPPRPVVEVEEDAINPTTYPPPTYQPTTFQPPAFRPNPPADLPVPTRQQFRGQPAEEAVFARGPRPSPLPLEEQAYTREDDLRQDIAEEQATTRPRPAPQDDIGFTRARPVQQEEQGFNRARPEEQSYQRPSRPAVQQPEEQPSFQRARPTQQEYHRPRPQPQEEQNLVRGRAEAKPAYNRAQLQARPPKPQPEAQPVGKRQRKPTAQVIRKYRDDNPDGSITWGFENDDGTFKEETIGTDCVTHGKYGYIDPDGVRREYTYSSGSPCDKNRDSEVGATNEGYIDYTNNKYIAPNGQEIDLQGMVKNRARRPVYRN